MTSSMIKHAFNHRNKNRENDPNHQNRQGSNKVDQFNLCLISTVTDTTVPAAVAFRPPFVLKLT